MRVVRDLKTVETQLATSKCQGPKQHGKATTDTDESEIMGSGCHAGIFESRAKEVCTIRPGLYRA